MSTFRRNAPTGVSPDEEAGEKKPDRTPPKKERDPVAEETAYLDELRPKIKRRTF